MEKNSVVSLAGIEPFATGTTRKCYVHPHNPSVCIKILLIPGARRHRWSQRKQVYRYSVWYRLKRFTKHLSDANLNEWQGHLHAQSQRGEWVWRHLPRCYGFVETDLGLGLAVELLRHDNGEIATTLSERFRQRGEDASFRSAWAEFKDFVLKIGIYTRSLHNVLSVVKNGEERLYFAEPKWRRPGFSRVPYFRRKRLVRKIALMENEIIRARRLPSESGAV